MNIELLNEISILNPNTIKIVSNSTHMFNVDGVDYALRYFKKDNFILVDLYILDKENGNRPSDVRVGSSKISNGVWSRVLTSVSEYIYYNKPDTIKIACTDERLEIFYDHMFLFIKRFRQFNGYMYNKENTPDGVLYVISRDIDQIDECIGKYLRGEL